MSYGGRPEDLANAGYEEENNVTSPEDKPDEGRPRIGQILRSPVTGEEYEVTALGKRYLLVEVKTAYSRHEFPRRYDEIGQYEIVRNAPLPECGERQTEAVAWIHPNGVTTIDNAGYWRMTGTTRALWAGATPLYAAPVSASGTLPVPEGMKCVPIKPTRRMLDIGYETAAFPRDPEIAAAMWTAMVEAAPTLPYAVSTSGALVQTVLAAIKAIPPDSVDDIEKAVATMSKTSVAAYFRARGLNQAESAFLEAVSATQERSK